MHARLIGVILCNALALSGLGAFELVSVSSFEKVRPESEPVRGQTVLALAAARNEREAGQVVIVPDGETLHGVTVAVSALQHSDTAFRIGADRIEVRLVGYTAIETPSWRGARQPGRWPDPLLEIRPFTVPAGETRCIWITVAVPADAPAGEYAGTLTIGHRGRRNASR